MDLLLAAAATALIISIIDYWIDIQFYRVPTAVLSSGVSAWILLAEAVTIPQLLVWAAAGAFIALTSIQVLYSMTKVSSASLRGRR